MNVFTFDLERMKKVVDSPSIQVPIFDTFEEFDAWIESLDEHQFKVRKLFTDIQNCDEFTLENAYKTLEY